jgi:hypothetical protein
LSDLLRSKDSDYPFDIFKLFFEYLQNVTINSNNTSTHIPPLPTPHTLQNKESRSVICMKQDKIRLFFRRTDFFCFIGVILSIRILLSFLSLFLLSGNLTLSYLLFSSNEIFSIVLGWLDYRRYLYIRRVMHDVI